MIEAVAQGVGIKALLTWRKTTLPRIVDGKRLRSWRADNLVFLKADTIQANEPHTETEYDSEEDSKFEPGNESSQVAMCAVGTDQLSRNWTSNKVKSALGRGAEGLADVKKQNFAPMRQIASYSHLGQTRWNVVFTDEEVVIGRAYKAKKTEEGSDLYEYEDALDEYLGIEIAPIPWNQGATKYRLSALEGLLAFIILSFHKQHRELVPYNELPPLNIWYSVQEDTHTYYQHSITRTITMEKPEGIVTQQRGMLLRDNRSKFGFGEGDATLHIPPSLQGKVTVEQLRTYSDAFNAECRAYGRLHETRNEHLSVKCYGYITLTSDHEKQLEKKGGIVEVIERWADEYKELPLRAIVKEFVPEGRRHYPHLDPKTVSKMIRDLDSLHRLGIFVNDIKQDNYVRDVNIDFGRSMTVPHPCYGRKRVEYLYTLPAGKDLTAMKDEYEFDDMI
ncbi:kinetochore Sim4 complex subunit FTA2-domain-containing protein [Whalleya microplaca]|nr:kinetochore Sim4 complex subunit FTA2-domain-containing protein [Whalleya microplaca]